MTYNPFYKDLQQQGVFNTVDASSEMEIQYYTCKITHHNRQHRVAVPKPMEAADADIGYFWWEPVQGSKFIRRCFEVAPYTDKPDLKRNPRKLHFTGSGFYVLIPYHKILVPKGNWTHVRFHISPHPNVYYLEFIKVDASPANKSLSETFIANPEEFPTSQINWD